jgi:hypothetical protein
MKLYYLDRVQGVMNSKAFRDDMAVIREKQRIRRAKKQEKMRINAKRSAT